MCGANKLNFIGLLTQLCFLFQTNLIISCQNEYEVVNTKLGPVKGIKTKFNDKSVSQFFGIPYAVPPLEELRFARPIRLTTPWKDVKDVTKPKAACMQKPHPSLNVNVTEDCLYLNIWKPNNIKKSLPVLFWIHGGYFTSGHIDRDEYNGIALASVGEVIVVSANYRLDAFGFLFGDCDHAPGNVGWHDQQMALLWVHENIASFGGDPNQVTLVGESAGSVSVGAHIVSPSSRSYFKRAIMQSGSPFKFQGMHKKDVTPLNSLKQAKLMARDLDCEEEWLKCLKKVETLKILNWVIKNKSFYPLYTNSTDGFLPLNSSFPKAFESGNFKKDVELLIGTVANEGSAYLKNEIPLYFNRENQRLIDKPLAKKLVSEMFNYSNIESDLIADFYISHIYHEERNELRKGVAYAFGDFRIVCPVYYFSKNVAHYSQISRVFSFQFTFKPTIGLAKNCVDWMGVCHADDIVFTFGVPLRHPQNYSVEDYYFSLLIINVWTSFVKTGNPAPSHYYGISPFQSKHIEWPQFRLKKDIAPNYMILHPKHFGNVIYYPYHNNCEGLWGKYFL